MGQRAATGDLEREREAHRDGIHARAYIVAQAEHAVQVLQHALKRYREWLKSSSRTLHEKQQRTESRMMHG